MKKRRQLTYKEAQAAYDAAPEVPVSKKRIDEIVRYVIDHDPAEALADELLTDAKGEKFEFLVLKHKHSKLWMENSYSRAGIIAAIHRHYQPTRKPITIKAALKLADKIGKPPKRRKRCPGK